MIWSFPVFGSKVEYQASRKKSLVVIDFKTNNLDVFKIHVVAGMVDMACNFGVLIETCHCLFVLRNSGL